MNKKLITTLSLLYLPFIITSCQTVPHGSESTTSSLISSEMSDEPAIEQEDEVALKNSQEYKLLFAHGSIININVSISKEALSFISCYQLNKTDKYSDFYVPCDFILTLNGVTYEFLEAGIRLKGNTSRGNVVNGSNIIENFRHYKISFKETFDSEEYENDPLLHQFYKNWTNKSERSTRKDRTLFGMKKLNLKYVPRNFLNGDSSTLREVYCYKVFEEAGLMSPKSNICDFTLSNDVSTKVGTYEIVEDIDKIFLQRRLSKQDSKGDLYKCGANMMGWASLYRTGAVTKELDENGFNIGTAIPYGKIGVDDTYNHNYVATYSLKTNDDDGNESDFSNMVRFINTLHDVAYAGAGNKILESVLDIDSWCKFSAISYIVGNFDDLRGNNNNYYIYFLPSTGKAIFIPYDYDWTLGIDCNCHCENWLPYGDEHQTGGEDVTSIFYVTFLKAAKSGHDFGSLDRTSYIELYGDYVKSYYSKILNIQRYKSFTQSFEVNNSTETSVVEYYMYKKFQTIINNI